jgi:phosphoglycolate phosphatase-like HAD superfamily hydrolase
MRFRDWIWDFDGTLADSYPWILQSFAKALAENNINPPRIELLSALKVSIRAAAYRFAIPNGLDPDAVLRRCGEIERAFETLPPRKPGEKTDEQLHGFGLYPGIARLCAKHAANGGRHFLYTHRDSRAYDMLEKSGVRALFTGGVTRDDGFPRKPAPDAILHIIRQYGLDHASTVMIGDRDVDVLAGRAAGVGECLFDPDRHFDTFPSSLRAHSAAELESLLEHDSYKL